MSKKSIVLHLDTPWYNALSRLLKKESMTVEEKLDGYLDSLIEQLPEMVRRKNIETIANELEGLRGTLSGLLAEEEAYRKDILEDFQDFAQYEESDEDCYAYIETSEACNALGEAVNGLESVIASLDELARE